MKFRLALLAVKDVEVSKTFYGELFDQSVVLDLGLNVTFSGGFAIQQKFAWLTNIPEDSVLERSNNMELYFEVEDFDDFMRKLEAYSGVELVHAPKMYEWKQRVVRLYDPDHHMIEVGESMAFLVRKYLSQGHTPEETAEILQHPLEFVKSCM